MVTSSMVMLLAVTSNIFGAVFARLGTASWITQALLALPLPPTLMLIVILFLSSCWAGRSNGRRSCWCSCRSSIRRRPCSRA